MHYHLLPNGLFEKCYRHCKNTFLSVNFWLGVTLSFPLEHFLWEKVWPFSIIGKMLMGN